ncbi:hypothetical protein HZB04_00345 [Candidatus Wolfebacteria bacterium]|nr:hypothetical protein [Candidatus Wolfebacteria bacterium]
MIKIALAGIVLVVGVLGARFITANFFPPEADKNIELPQNRQNLSFNSELKIKNPLQYLKEKNDDNAVFFEKIGEKKDSGAKESENKSRTFPQGIQGKARDKEVKNNEKQNSGEQNENNSVKSQVGKFQANESVLSIGQLFESIIGGDKVENNAEKTAEYYKKFLEIVVKTTFNQKEADLAKKDKNGRIISLEELIYLAINGAPIDELKNSFKNWQSLDEKILAALETLPDNLKISSANKILTDWYKYHLSVAKKFSEENLDQDQISQIENEFRLKADIHNKNFKKSVMALEKSSEFSLVKKADAFTCTTFFPPGFYSFGGRIIVPPFNECIVPPVGIIRVVAPPTCGAVLLFPYPIIAALPMIVAASAIGSDDLRNLTLAKLAYESIFWFRLSIPGTLVFGKSILIPGTCFGIGIPIVFGWEAVVLYWGTPLF